MIYDRMLDEGLGGALGDDDAVSDHAVKGDASDVGVMLVIVFMWMRRHRHRRRGCWRMRSLYEHNLEQPFSS